TVLVVAAVARAGAAGVGGDDDDDFRAGGGAATSRETLTYATVGWCSGDAGSIPGPWRVGVSEGGTSVGVEERVGQDSARGGRPGSRATDCAPVPQPAHAPAADGRLLVAYLSAVVLP